MGCCDVPAQPGPFPLGPCPPSCCNKQKASICGLVLEGECPASGCVGAHLPCMQTCCVMCIHGCSPGSASQCIYLCTPQCAHTGVHQHRIIRTLCAPLCAALGSVHNCPPMRASPAVLQSQPAHLWLRTCCIPICVPVPVCAALAEDPHRWLRAVAPAGCKYCQCGGEVERFMAQGQAHES